ncbi:aminoglycoside N(3)-acetyltransferase [Paenibacillus sp. 481]|uniref:aminoglycoside N(3)-acetyltransferase n=1 Tax=Paenibacillus sp. 481 TaxID=2835869 RepID=UPI001E633094|nr:AAC(3) family N-acetyltransferase [Paenibacillus sp. 481]UHA72779.1 AAC(3) family N-acetyltransferase [Paenibacillus sp. 481]
MSEQSIVEQTPRLLHRESLADDLRRLGLSAGMTVLVHSSLSRLGWICGGPVAVIQALQNVVTEEGTIVMPAHTADYSDPSYWQAPPVPESWWEPIRETMPAFDPNMAPTRQMGIIAETFRKCEGVRRSYHPSVSFCAWGKHAEIITNDHRLDESLGEGSPLARVYDLDGWVLLLGVDYDNHTSFHLAEYRMNNREMQLYGAPILEQGQRVWKTYTDVATSDEDFDQLGADFERVHTDSVNVGKVGISTSRFMKQRVSVDYATAWFNNHRQRSTSSS